VANEVIEGIRGSLRKQGEAATKRIEEMAKTAGVAAETKVLEGHPANDIIKLAEGSKMNLIVVGSIGVTGLDKFLLGSVTEKVVRNSKVPGASGARTIIPGLHAPAGSSASPRGLYST